MDFYYKLLSDPVGTGSIATEFLHMKADSIVQAQQKIGKLLLDEEADEAVIYAPVRILSAKRIVEVTDGNNRKLDNAGFFTGNGG